MINFSKKDQRQLVFFIISLANNGAKEQVERTMLLGNATKPYLRIKWPVLMMPIAAIIRNKCVGIAVAYKIHTPLVRTIKAAAINRAEYLTCRLFRLNTVQNYLNDSSGIRVFRCFSFHKPAEHVLIFTG